MSLIINEEMKPGHKYVSIDYQICYGKKSVWECWINIWDTQQRARSNNYPHWDHWL